MKEKEKENTSKNAKKDRKRKVDKAKKKTQYLNLAVIRAANKRNVASIETDSLDSPQTVPAAISPVSPSKKPRRTASASRMIVPQAEAELPCEISKLKEKIMQDAIWVSKMIQQLNDMTRIRLGPKQTSTRQENFDL